MAALSLVSIVANGLVIAATLITPNLRTVSNYFIIALAVAEALATVTYTVYICGTFNPPLIRFTGEFCTSQVFKCAQIHSK